MLIVGRSHFMDNFTQHEDFTFGVNRMCFDENDAKMSGARAVEIHQEDRGIGRSKDDKREREERDADEHGNALKEPSRDVAAHLSGSL